MISIKIIIPAITISTATLFSACGSKEKRDVINQDSKILVTVSTPNQFSSSGEIDVSGQVESSQTATISTRMMGYINTIHVKTGEFVRPGQLLVSISSADIAAKRSQADAMVAQAKAAFASAQKDYDRFTALYKTQSATAKELDNATLQYNIARTNLHAAEQLRNEASAQFSYANITAPFAGVIIQKLMDAGNMASPGMPILVIERNGSFQVSVNIPESQIGAIKLNSKATIEIRSINKKIVGNVTQISQSSRFSGGQYLVKIAIADNQTKGLYSGMYANVSIAVKDSVSPIGDVDAILVPKESVFTRDQLTGLYTIGSDSTALLRWVRLGKDYGEKVEVLSGLAKNEIFITQTDERIYNGAPVRVR